MISDELIYKIYQDYPNDVIAFGREVAKASTNLQSPAAAINEQMLEALKELMYARTDKAEGMAEAAIAAAEAEKAKGGV